MYIYEAISVYYINTLQLYISLKIKPRSPPPGREILAGAHASRHWAACSSERNIVVHVAVARASTRRHRPARRGTDRPGRAEIAAAIVGAEAGAPAATAVEHRQGGVEALQDDFGRVLLDAALVGPFAGLKRAFDI